MENKTKKINNSSTQILVFSLSILIITLLAISLKQFTGKKKLPSTTEVKESQISQEVNKSKIPAKIILRKSPQSIVKISIKNTTGKSISLRAFTIEAVANKDLSNLTEEAIEKGGDLEKAGFIFPLRKLEIKDQKTIFKIGGLLIGNKIEITSNQEITLISINLNSDFQEELNLGEETKIIDDSGNLLSFTVERE